MVDTISIITAIHNQLPYNRLFWESLSANTFFPYQLIIIDNASTDGSGDFFRQKGAVVIVNSENKPYSVAQNQGLQLAGSEIVAFLNNDICLSKNWDKRLVEYLFAYGLEMISPSCLETMETDLSIRHMRKKWNRVNAIQRLRGLLDLDYSEDSLKRLISAMYGNWDLYCTRRAKRFVNFLYPGYSGCAIVVRKRIFQAVGIWNETVACADADLALRVIRHQAQNSGISGPHIAGDVFVHHFIGGTYKWGKNNRNWNRLASIEDIYSPGDLRYASIPKASIIVAVYQQYRYLELVMEGLLRQEVKDFEVVIADDGSGPEIDSVIKAYTDRFRYPIQHIRHDHDGFRKTIIANRAVMAARSPYLIFIDGDCIVHHRFIQRHLLRRRVGWVLSGRRVMLNETVSRELTSRLVETGVVELRSLWWRGCELASRKFGKYRPWMYFLKNAYHRDYEIVGCNFSVYKGDFLRINGYDERIVGRGLEDNNLCNRFKRAGVRIRSVATEALQYHLHHHFDPIPHNKKVILEYGNPDYFWTPNGIRKSSEYQK